MFYGTLLLLAELIYLFYTLPKNLTLMSPYLHISPTCFVGRDSEYCFLDIVCEVVSILSCLTLCFFFREHLSKIYSPVVFCHNDLQQGNILIRDDSTEPQIVLIDFEYCSYNYRGFDLANHFIEWTYDYNTPDYPNFRNNKANYPSHLQMVRQICFILKIFNLLTDYKHFPVSLFYQVSNSLILSLRIFCIL